MAKIFPDRIDPTTPRSEAHVLKAFTRLDDHWRVFHSVAWQSKRGGRQADGEADFVLLHPQKGALVIEVKGGGVELRNGTWLSVNAEGVHAIKNPFEQAIDSKYALIAYLRSLDPPVRDCRVEHAVAFPDITVVDTPLGLDAPRAIVIDRKDLREPRAAIARICTHWDMHSAISREEMSRIVKLLAPTTRITRRLRDDVADALEQLALLTEEQQRTLALLRRERRAVIEGGAGTGKTVLAMQRTRALYENGFKTALLCYNAPLGSWLTRELRDVPAYTGTFHSLCMQQAAAAQIPTPVTPSNDWWERQAASVLVEAASKTGLRFDAVVVDEGQDFSSDWLHALETLLESPDDAPYYLFADPHQDLYARGFSMPAWPRQSLTLNCRNTIPIARRVANVFGEPAPVIGATGPEAIFVHAHLGREGRKQVQRTVTRLIEEEGLLPQQVAVLSDDVGFLASLRLLLVGEHSFTRIGGRGIVADTIARFKGLEADAVVLCLSDALLREAGSVRSAAYVGLSRARTVLYVLGSSAIQQRLAW